jgi:hypothetical protein
MGRLRSGQDVPPSIASPLGPDVVATFAKRSHMAGHGRHRNPKFLGDGRRGVSAGLDEVQDRLKPSFYGKRSLVKHSGTPSRRVLVYQDMIELSTRILQVELGLARLGETVRIARVSPSLLLSREPKDLAGRTPLGATGAVDDHALVDRIPRDMGRRVLSDHRLRVLRNALGWQFAIDLSPRLDLRVIAP